MDAPRLIAAMAAFALASSGISRAWADNSVTVIGISPYVACAIAAANAKAVPASARLDACDRAIQIWPAVPTDKAVAYVNRSVIDLARVAPQAALLDTAAAIRLNPALAEAYVDRGIALSAVGRAAEAISAFTQALSLDPPHPELVYFNRAIAREDSGDAKGAYFDYRQAAALNPAWDKPRHELARFTVLAAPAS